MIIEIIFWGSVFFVFHTYVIYPLLLRLLSSGKKDNHVVYPAGDNDLPEVSILMSLYNEEKVIEEKIMSIYHSEYPADKIEVIVGSDNSTDNTNIILEKLTGKYSSLQFFPYAHRQGKAAIINRLYKKARGQVLILTDANVMLDKDTVYNLVKHFKNPEIGLVDTNMINKGLTKEGISLQEKTYISREVIIKNYESRIWGTMMGPFGGCYALRRELYSEVPPNYLVDDFYINMMVFVQKHKAINDLNARVYEDVSDDLGIEFRRKVRIATGNFQNLRSFARLLFPPFTGLSFSFMSHKILRWFGPFFIILALVSCLYLSLNNEIYLYLFLCQCGLLILPFIDFFLRYLRIHIIILRFITHFYSMNLALLFGFFRFIAGVRSGIWTPTQRHQAGS